MMIIISLSSPCSAGLAEPLLSEPYQLDFYFFFNSGLYSKKAEVLFQDLLCRGCFS